MIEHLDLYPRTAVLIVCLCAVKLAQRSPKCTAGPNRCCVSGLASQASVLTAGQGSYGTVYKASVRNTDQLVAIKILPLGQHNEQATIQKEIDMLKECEHPNIVRYMVGLPVLRIVLGHAVMMRYANSPGLCRLGRHMITKRFRVMFSPSTSRLLVGSCQYVMPTTGAAQ